MLLFQADSDFFVLAELLKDYIGLIQAVKVGESDVMLKYVPFTFFLIMSTVLIKKVFSGSKTREEKKPCVELTP